VKTSGPRLPEDWHTQLKRGRGVVAELEFWQAGIQRGSMAHAMAREGSGQAALVLASRRDDLERQTLLAGQPLFLFSASGLGPDAGGVWPAAAFEGLHAISEVLLRHPLLEPAEGRRALPGFCLRAGQEAGAPPLRDHFLPGEWIWEQSPGYWKARLLLVDLAFVEGLAHGLGRPFSRGGEFPIVLAERIIDEWMRRMARRVEQALRLPAAPEPAAPALLAWAGSQPMGVPARSLLPGLWPEWL
jgi:hypothetical protein